MIEKNLNALVVLILCAILTAALFIQFVEHETPCPLCYLQRLAMIGVASAALLNIKSGIRSSHYGLLILTAIAGSLIALRHITLHICPQFSVFGVPVMGLSLYTWSFLIFLCSIAFSALMLFLNEWGLERRQEPGLLGSFGYFWLFAIVLVNAVAVLAQCGLGVCE